MEEDKLETIIEDAKGCEATVDNLKAIMVAALQELSERDVDVVMGLEAVELAVESITERLEPLERVYEKSSLTLTEVDRKNFAGVLLQSQQLLGYLSGLTGVPDENAKQMAGQISQVLSGLVSMMLNGLNVPSVENEQLSEEGQ